MNILGVDATGEAMSLALLASGRVLKTKRRAMRPHDETLISAADDLLRSAGLKASQLDAVAAASGPGRFTGIRIGMAYAAVASLSLKIPALAVSRLEASARRSSAALVCAALPGWRDERYYQAFRRTKTGALRPSGPPSWISREGWEAMKKTLDRAEIVEIDTDAADLLPIALLQLASKTRPAFAPLYLKPAGYEARR